MELSGVFLSALVLLSSSKIQDIGQYKYNGDYLPDGHHNVTVCPDDYSPRDGCVTLDQLLSDKLIESNTTFKFVSATFNMKQVIRFENVSNITLQSAGPHKASISCVGENSGFSFNNVSGLAIQNVTLTNCDGHMNIDLGGISVLDIMESSDVILANVTLEHGKGGGIFISNIYGYLTILNCAFTHLKGPGIYLSHSSKFNYQRCGITMIAICNSQFSNYHESVTQYSSFAASAYAIVMYIGHIPIRAHIQDVIVSNNTHRSDISGILILSSPSVPASHIVIERLHYDNNSVIDVVSSRLTGALGVSDLFYVYNANSNASSNKSIIEIIDSHFVNNDYSNSNQDIELFKIDNTLYAVLSFNVYNLIPSIIIRNTTVSNNNGWYGATIYLETTSVKLNGDNFSFQIDSTNITNNKISISDYYRKGAVYFNGVGNFTVKNCNFVNNSATGLLIENSNVYFTGNNVIRGNKGYNGGGLALYGESTLHLLKNVTILFEDNYAENVGGGLYVKQNIDNIYRNRICFILHQGDKASLEFNNNFANSAGNDWYGGFLYMCKIYHTPTQEYIGWQIVTDIIALRDNYTIDVTSDPLHVCDCSSTVVSSQHCINVVHTIQSVQTYPGKLFNLSLIAVGQLLNTTTMSGVPSAIYASLLPLNHKNATIPNHMQVQNGERTCSNLTYRVRSFNENETVIMVLTVDDNVDKITEYFRMLWQQNLSLWQERVEKLFLHDLTVPAYVTIHLQYCPVGFELSETGVCDCFTSLTDFVTSCSIDTMLITRKSPVWLSFTNNSEDSIKYLIHKHCPFDYCILSNLNFSLEDPDAQCNHNRSGILCGQCKSGYSLTLGRMECRQCTNIYLLLLIPFGLAGIVLIVFLSLTDMTVAAGTINGLLFFANVVRENQATFFPSQAAKGFLSVFIAWLNLDFGITTCFYDGLDSYANTWLQLSFPIFIWLLAFSIIIASRHFTFMNKVCGQNIVPVLATLFLLSYTKFQRTIASSLSFTLVSVSNGTDYYVWLQDGNVRYLQGKHIPLGLVSILLLVVLFIPYTLSVILGPWLQSKTQYRVFCWVIKLKPLFDAYFGPLKDRHRYWTGVLLVSRMILSLVSAVNVFGDDGINLVAINTLIFLLLAIIWQSGGVYKIWTFSVLDTFFFINLGVLSLVTMYNKVYDVHRQYATICVSVGSVFAVFCTILFYHCLKKLAQHGLFPTIFRRKLRPRAGSNESGENSDNDLLDLIDEGRTSD